MNVVEAGCRLEKLIAASRAKIGSGTDVIFVDYEYESILAALMEIVLQHAESLRELAKGEDRFFFSAASCARSAMEAAIILTWIRKPNDRLIKEGRWLGYYATMERFHQNMSRELSATDPGIDEPAAKLRAIHEVIKSRTVAGVPIPIQEKPSVEVMLRELGYADLYSSYRELCQIVHVGPEMVFRFRKGVEYENGLTGFRVTRRMFGNEWHVPFLAIAWSVALAVIETLVELGETPENLRSVHEAQKHLTDYIQGG